MTEVFQVPKISAPQLPPASNLQFNATKVSLAPQLQAIPTIPAPEVGLKTLVGEAGVPDLSLKGTTKIPSLPPINFPKIPTFPGIDLPGLTLGKSPKFIAETVLKYKTISPPFIPGVKMNIGIVLAAASVIKSATSGGAGEMVKHLIGGLMDDVVKDITSPISDTTNSVQSTIDGTLANAQNSVNSLTQPIESATESVTANVTDQTDKINVTIPPNG